MADKLKLKLRTIEDDNLKAIEELQTRERDAAEKAVKSAERRMTKAQESLTAQWQSKLENISSERDAHANELKEQASLLRQNL